MMEGKKIQIGLSGGINSAAVLMWLFESGQVPKELHLYYAHFRQHSRDTAHFVVELMRFARRVFPNVITIITRNDVIQFFDEQHMIPHPAISPCSKKLKIDPMDAYSFRHGIEINLIGYVKEELKRRAGRAAKYEKNIMFEAHKTYPIGEFSDEWCFEIVKKHLGWYPAIYDIRDEQGNRIFKHNNCLPCKNMTTDQLAAVEKYFPLEFEDAMRLSGKLKRHWGRDSAEFYTKFGRDLGQESTCTNCKW